MTDLAKRAPRGLVAMQLAVAALLFLPAGTLRFWQAWLFWGVFGSCVLGITL